MHNSTPPTTTNLEKISVSDFIALCNQALDYAFSGITVEGEVASFKINQGKWVFFDLKDEISSISCFLPVFQLRMPLTDGMKVVVRGVPKLTKWGKFSLTVHSIMPIGEGSIKKSFDLLKAKLTKEGLFDPAKKRPLPAPLTEIGVISSTQAAGYADFIKILNERWGGLHVHVAHTGVQGLTAADQIIRALDYFNQHQQVQIIAIIRGGGSADDLAVFNDERLVRAIAASRIPIITGIGHEVDESLADLAADLRASTPSNAAQMLTKDRSATIQHLHQDLGRLKNQIFTQVNRHSVETMQQITAAQRQIFTRITAELSQLAQTIKLLDQLNPEHVLAQGYAIVSGKLAPGQTIAITTSQYQLNAEITHVQPRTPHSVNHH